MNELDKLDQMLTNAGIPFERIQQRWESLDMRLISEFSKLAPLYGEVAQYRRNQIIYGRAKNGGLWKLDAICQYGSYGAAQGLIETYGRLGVDKEKQPRVMTASEAFEIIRKDWEETEK